MAPQIPSPDKEQSFMNRSIPPAVLTLALLATPAHAQPAAFFQKHCHACHDSEAKKGGLDLTTLKSDLNNAENFARWVKVHDRIETGEMPPSKSKRPPASEVSAALQNLR